MSARAHLCVVLLFASTSTAGCLFGGGGKKPAANVTQAANPSDAGAPGAGAGRPSDIAPPGADGRDESAGAAPSPRDARAVDEAVARALAPRPSDVEWPQAGAFRLGDDASADPHRAEADTTYAASIGEDVDHVAPAGPAPSQLHSGHPDDPRTARGSPAFPGSAALQSRDAALEAGVANEQLELPADAPPPAPRGGHDLASSPVSADSGELSRTLSQRLRDNPGDLAVHLDYQLLRFLEDEPVPDLDAIAGLQGEDREVLTALIDALSNFRNGVRADGNMLLSQKIKPLLDLGGRLRSQAELSIATISLCRRVKAFGIYEPMPGRFAAGVESHAIAYCELDNVSARRNDQGEWESKLTQEAVLYREDGQSVWSNPRQAIIDRSRNRRQDFFVAQPITLLPTLTIGRYWLKITVEDEQVRRVAEATVPIEIVAALPPQQQQIERGPRRDKPASVPTPGRAPDSLGPVTEDQRLGGHGEPEPAAARQRSRSTRDGDAFTGTGELNETE